MKAVKRFDPERGVKFETFAVPRIRGAVFDGLRQLDWVPRSVRSRAREVESAFASLEAKLGRAPSDDELADALHISSEELEKWLVSIASTTVGPLDRALAAGAETRQRERGVLRDDPVGDLGLEIVTAQRLRLEIACTLKVTKTGGQESRALRSSMKPSS